MFTSSLEVKVDRHGEIRTLLSPLFYQNYKFHLNIKIPIGFETNYGSVPMVFQNIISASGKATYAYVLHDYLYSNALVPKDEADRILFDEMRRLGVPCWKARLVYLALYFFGFKAWNKCRENDIKKEKK